MRNTKIMLAAIATYITTFLSITFFAWIFSNGYTFKECAIFDAVILIQIIFGWIPSAVVSFDLSNK